MSELAMGLRVAIAAVQARLLAYEHSPCEAYRLELIRALRELADTLERAEPIGRRVARRYADEWSGQP